MPEDYKPQSVHPGRYLKEWLMPNCGMSIEDLSSHTEIDGSVIAGIMDCNIDVDRDVAIRLSNVFAGEAETLLRMQYEYNYSSKNEGKFPQREQLPHLTL